MRATSVSVPGSVSSLASIEEQRSGNFIIATGSSQSQLHLFQYSLDG